MIEDPICAECGEQADDREWDEALEMCWRCAEEFERSLERMRPLAPLAARKEPQDG